MSGPFFYLLKYNIGLDKLMSIEIIFIVLQIYMYVYMVRILITFLLYNPDIL